MSLTELARTYPRVAVAVGVAAAAPFVLLATYAALWTGYALLGVPPAVAVWLSLGSVLVLPYYTGRVAFALAATLDRAECATLRRVPPETACETTLELPVVREPLPQFFRHSGRLVDLDDLTKRT